MTEPRLLDRRQIAAELGVTLTTAETVMRQCAKIRIGRRVFVDRQELERYLAEQTFDRQASSRTASR